MRKHRATRGRGAKRPGAKAGPVREETPRYAIDAGHGRGNLDRKRPGRISATELARNLAKAIDQVRVSGRDLLIVKGARTVARLCPPPKAGVPIAQLPGILRSLPHLDDDDARAMAADLDALRGAARLPPSAWD